MSIKVSQSCSSRTLQYDQCFSKCSNGLLLDCMALCAASLQQDISSCMIFLKHWLSPDCVIPTEHRAAAGLTA